MELPAYLPDREIIQKTKSYDSHIKWNIQEHIRERRRKIQNTSELYFLKVLVVYHMLRSFTLTENEVLE